MPSRRGLDEGPRSFCDGVSRAGGAGQAPTKAPAPKRERAAAVDSARDPRMHRARQRAIAAALDLIVERGIAGASIEAVCARSGMAKTTIYRQWPNQAALVLDAFRSIAPDPPVPDTGTLRGDLQIPVGGFAAALGTGRAAVLMAALIDAAQRDEDFAHLHAQETRRRHQPVLVVLARGVERGELPTGTTCTPWSTPWPVPCSTAGSSPVFLWTAPSANTSSTPSCTDRDGCGHRCPLSPWRGRSSAPADLTLR